MANIGQVKNLFSFDVSSIDYYNGVLPTLTVINGGDQRVGAGSGFLPIPLCVQVKSGASPLTNAPLTFSVTQGVARLSTTNAIGVPLSGTLQVRSNSQSADPQGNTQAVAQVYIYASGTDCDLSIIKAVAATGTASVSVATTAATTDSTLTPPSNFQAYLTTGSTVQLTWTPSDNSQPTTVQVSTDGGATWQTVGVAAAGVTTANITGITPSTSLLFRVSSGGSDATSGTNGSVTFPMPSGGGSPSSGGGSASTSGSNPTVVNIVPVRTYAAIDMGELAPLSNGNDGSLIQDDSVRLAIDDDNHVAYLKSDGIYAFGQSNKITAIP